MADEVVDTVYDSTGSRRAVIFRRSTGTYGYREEKHFKNDVAEGWRSFGGRVCHWDTLETAKRELPSNVTWLTSHQGNA
jgi:hypothetical protein